MPAEKLEALLAAARQQLVVGVTGPRQAGKTTLVRSCFPDHAYLEPVPKMIDSQNDKGPN